MSEGKSLSEALKDQDNTVEETNTGDDNAPEVNEDDLPQGPGPVDEDTMPNSQGEEEGDDTADEDTSSQVTSDHPRAAITGLDIRGVYRLKDGQHVLVIDKMVGGVHRSLFSDFVVRNVHPDDVDEKLGALSDRFTLV